MRGTTLMEALEQRHGKPLRELLIDLHRQYDGDVEKVAEALGVTRATVYNWRRQVGLTPSVMALILLDSKGEGSQS